MRLQSSDGVSFDVPQDTFVQSTMLRNLSEDMRMYSSCSSEEDEVFHEDDEIAIPVNNIPADILRAVLEFLRIHKGSPPPVYPHLDLTTALRLPHGKDVSLHITASLDETDTAFLAQFSKDQLSELLQAANFLDIQRLLNVICTKFVRSLRETPRESWGSLFLPSHAHQQHAEAEVATAESSSKGGSSSSSSSLSSSSTSLSQQQQQQSLLAAASTSAEPSLAAAKASSAAAANALMEHLVAQSSPVPASGASAASATVSSSFPPSSSSSSSPSSSSAVPPTPPPFPSLLPELLLLVLSEYGLRGADLSELSAVVQAAGEAKSITAAEAAYYLPMFEAAARIQAKKLMAAFPGERPASISDESILPSSTAAAAAAVSQAAAETQSSGEAHSTVRVSWKATLTELEVRAVRSLLPLLEAADAAAPAAGGAALQEDEQTQVLEALCLWSSSERFTLIMADLLPRLLQWARGMHAASTRQVLNRMLQNLIRCDGEAAHVVRKVVRIFKGVDTLFIEDERKVALGALSVLSQNMVSRHPGVRRELISCLDEFIAALGSPDATVATYASRCIRGVSIGIESEQEEQEVCARIYLQGGLRKLQDIYVETEQGSDLERACGLALSTLCGMKSNSAVVRQLVDVVLGTPIPAAVSPAVEVPPEHLAPEHAQLYRAIGALSILNKYDRGSARPRHSKIAECIPQLMQVLRSGPTAARVHASLTLEGFASGDADIHFKVITAGVPALLIEIANNANEAHVLRESVAATFTSVIHTLPDKRRGELAQLIVRMWETPDRPGAELENASKFIYDLTDKEKTGFEFVSSTSSIQNMIALCRNGEEAQRVASTIMLHKLCMCDETTRVYAVEHGCILPVVEMFRKGEVREQEVSSYALVTFACGTEGAEQLVKHLPLLVERAHGPLSRKVEIGLTSILGNLATYCGTEARKLMVSLGVIKILEPIMRSADPSRHAVVAAMAIANLVAHDENKETRNLLAADMKLIQQVMDALKATLKGVDYQDISFEPWAPAQVISNLSLHFKSRMLIILAGGVGQLVQLLAVKDELTLHYALKALINIGKDHDLSIERVTIAEDIGQLLKASHSPQVRALCTALLAEVDKYAHKRHPKKML